jgi:ribosomal-protein-serine acetyltransferase
MIEPKVTSDIELILLNDSFASEYAELARKDFDYLSEWLEWPRFCVTEADFRKFISDSVSGHESGETMNCAIRYKGAIAGVAGFNKIDSKLRRVEIGYWLGADFQRKGVVTLVCRHLIQYAFRHLEIDKIQISVAAGNLPSRAVCERLEMKLEGIISNEERIGDKLLSHAIYALHSE